MAEQLVLKKGSRVKATCGCEIYEERDVVLTNFCKPHTKDLVAGKVIDSWTVKLEGFKVR